MSNRWITVPTEYDSNAMGSGDRLSQYTKDFSETIDDSIIVLWTGSAVVTEGISVDNAQTVKEIYGDNVGIWWNYPCTDYIQNKLGLGPIYGLDKGLADELDFLVMNPMEHAELSKITLATGADYSWNTAAMITTALSASRSICCMGILRHICIPLPTIPPPGGRMGFHGTCGCTGCARIDGYDDEEGRTGQRRFC